MIRIKICGICDLEGASAAVEAGADMIGFHFCSSDRHVTPEEALAILDELSVRPKVVGVFIDQPAEEVRQIAEYLDLDLLQLHGSEPAGFDASRPVMKVLKVKDGVLPDAPIVHPAVCGYPFEHLCAAAVAAKLAEALGAPTAEEDLDLVALATVADVAKVSEPPREATVSPLTKPL